MFSTETYINRRNVLKKSIDKGIILLPGNVDSPINYPSNTYKFRQDSNFLYYFGLDFENLAGVIDTESGEEILFGDNRDIEDIVWMGPEPSMEYKASLVGVEKTKPAKELAEYLKAQLAAGRKIHFLPQYRSELMISLGDILGIKASELNDHKSLELIKAVIAQRTLKTVGEIMEIENALAISYEMNVAAMKFSKPGLVEREIYGIVEGITHSLGQGTSFPTIFSVRGETLHNHHHENVMQEGDMLLMDSGAESDLHYASDITRTFPVSGKFTDEQKAIYNTVLAGQLKAIEAMKPGITYKEVHLLAAKTMAEGLKELGIMKGNIEEAVAQGAHALFFPHGLGHLLGLDVHDMEGLGETLSGYDNLIERSSQFGLCNLRFGKKLQQGMVLTVEPGLYFIPQLVANWKEENLHSEFINYDKVEEYIGFGGVRIEDDVLITEDGSRVLGKPIPKTVAEVEATCKN